MSRKIKKLGPWRVSSSKIIYRSPFLKVWEDKVITPEGQRGIHNLASGARTNSGGVSVVAVNEEGEIYLVKQYRYAHRGYTLEVINGGATDREAPLTAARRELREEANLLAKRWTKLGETEAGTETLRFRTHLYLALGLKELKSVYKGENLMKVVKVSLEEAVRLVRQGKIPLTGSALNILLAKDYLNNKNRN